MGVTLSTSMKSIILPSGLSRRTVNCLTKAGFPIEKTALIKALSNGTLSPHRNPSNYGKITHREVCRWVGIDESDVGNEMSAVYRHEFIVPPASVDENGHVNNVEYVKWMQEVAVMHSDSVGCTQATREAGAAWVARSHRIEYLRPAFAGDHLAVLTWITDFRRVRSRRKYQFVRTTDNAMIAEGETDWVFVDAKTGRPQSVPESVSSAFELISSETPPLT